MPSILLSRALSLSYRQMQKSQTRHKIQNQLACLSLFISINLYLAILIHYSLSAPNKARTTKNYVKASF